MVELNLEQMEVDRDVEGLIKALGNTDPDVRNWAAKYLGKVGDKRAVEPLIHAIGDENASVREHSIGALESIFGRLEKGDPIKSKAVEPLIQALEDENNFVRRNAASALGSLRDKRAVNYLIPLLSDGRCEVRGNVAEALGKLKDCRAVDALIEALWKENGYWDASYYVKYYIIEALGKIGDRRAVDPLIKVLEGGDFSEEYEEHETRGLRIQAIVSLGKLRDKKAVESLTRALEDADEDIRGYAKHALRRIRGEVKEIKEIKVKGFMLKSKVLNKEGYKIPDGLDVVGRKFKTIESKYWGKETFDSLKNTMDNIDSIPDSKKQIEAMTHLFNGDAKKLNPILGKYGLAPHTTGLIQVGKHGKTADKIAQAENLENTGEIILKIPKNTKDGYDEVTDYVVSYYNKHAPEVASDVLGFSKLTKEVIDSIEYKSLEV